MSITRRTVFKGALAGAAIPSLATALSARDTGSCTGTPPQPSGPQWGTGAEGQRIADLGNGTYRNPIVSGDHPDPTILKDGDVYYMTFSSFDYYPGLVIWESRDLVNWAPVGPALQYDLGTVWAVDLVKHDGMYYIYIPAAPQGKPWSIYAIWADDIRGPWSEPVDLNIPGCIDPGHVVGEDGKRYLFTNGIRKVRLTDNGLATDGPLEQAYDPWRYPDDWVVENFAPEGPKLMRHNGWFYLVTAIGGTAGPVTGHMVIAARSRSVNGPWEHCPHNPIVRTQSTAEPWWSRGHATLVEGPAGDWWMVYHGYENGMRTLGRQTLLQPIEWTADGWFRATGGDLSRPLPKPKGGKASASLPALSDDFSQDRMGLQWTFFAPKAVDGQRAVHGPDGLVIEAQGTSPADSSPLTCVAGDRTYQAEISLDLLDDEAEAGFLLFYNHKAFVGLGFTPTVLKIFEYSEELKWAGIPHQARSIRLRITNVENVITYHYSYDDGRTWQRHGTRMEVSGMHHNVFGGFLSLRLGIYTAGKGKVRLRDFRYRANGAIV
ncbi:family 43 glycosylhydrolase [Novosphingobium beihaiensis]|uniref:Family 43 glycosylhydrolase n=1 Tax=Novosphingobium beihaiensis TaxID=2930389 RepID=A0ABT0BQG2_9SPHN|nr:family 43 glycosylhydrolase [Novosphingobium beihaiensis]MCJ2187200.1 family 43 glycosylhydrolase [Novosphingobium beihaiensis]